MHRSIKQIGETTGMIERTTIGNAFKLKSGVMLSAQNMNCGKYPVFGGNGVSGYHDIFMFEEPMIVIGRVGAYCGNVHLTKPNSWITDNALYIDKKLQDYDDDYLVYLLRNLHLNQYASQSGQPLISYGRIKNIEIPLPPLATQQKIAAILDAADEYRQKTKTLIKKYDQLAQSLFLEMFGDPVMNLKGWEKKILSEIGKVITGNTPPRDNQEYYGNFIEWIKTDNINTPNIFIAKAEECLSELGLGKARFAEPGAILVTCIAGSKSVIGNVAIANRKVSFNQQINALQSKIGHYLFWNFQFITSKS